MDISHYDFIDDIIFVERPYFLYDEHAYECVYRKFGNEYQFKQYLLECIERCWFVFIYQVKQEDNGCILCRCVTTGFNNKLKLKKFLKNNS